MTEFFVRTASNAAPFCSDEDLRFVEGESAQGALDRRRLDYSHPAGLYAAQVWANANSFHKRETPMAEWLSDRALQSRLQNKS